MFEWLSCSYMKPLMSSMSRLYNRCIPKCQMLWIPWPWPCSTWCFAMKARQRQPSVVSGPLFPIALHHHFSRQRLCDPWIITSSHGICLIITTQKLCTTFRSPSQTTFSRVVRLRSVQVLVVTAPDTFWALCSTICPRVSQMTQTIGSAEGWSFVYTGVYSCGGFLLLLG